MERIIVCPVCKETSLLITKKYFYIACSQWALEASIWHAVRQSSIEPSKMEGLLASVSSLGLPEKEKTKPVRREVCESLLQRLSPTEHKKFMDMYEEKIPVRQH